MSVLIKGMRMPKNCMDCYAFRGHIPTYNWSNPAFYLCYNGCSFNRAETIEDIRQKPSWCPLIELPSHGDLIDRRKLPLAFVDVTDLPIDRCLPVYLKEDVDDAPIVIESEE